MLYLLALGWEWFAGAFALGAVVGWLTTTRAKDAVLSGGWVILAAVLALAAAAAVSAAGALAGREALTFDIATLAALAYFVGLPVGGGVRSLASEPAHEPRKPPPVVVLRGAPREAKTPAPTAPRPKLQGPALQASATDVANDDIAQVMPPPSGAPIVVESEPAPANRRAAKLENASRSFPGVAPDGMAEPRGGAADDLTRIKGLGPKSVERLNALGVYHYDQIAAWNLDNAKWIGAAIGAVGRVERGKWIQQARALADATRRSDAQ